MVARGFDAPTATLLAPFTPPMLTTGYNLVAEDNSFQQAVSQMTVTVRDTTPPMLTLGPADPSCLWVPDHKMVLYQLGSTIPFKAMDVCDADPSVQIVAVTSNQPDVGGGQGDFMPDIVFGKTGL